MFDRATLHSALEALFLEETVRFVTETPMSDHLLSGTGASLDHSYYLRHRIETVYRIRSTSRTDALALACMVVQDYDAARAWAKYLEHEINHDRLYLRDLAEHGINESTVLQTPAFPSTVALLNALDLWISIYGGLPAVAYSLFVEWNSARASHGAVERAERAFTERHVRGAKAHIGFDEREDHYQMMVDIAFRLCSRDETTPLLFEMLRLIAHLFRMYYCELYLFTMQARQMCPSD
jgi:hypothetical protein